MSDTITLTREDVYEIADLLELFCGMDEMIDPRSNTGRQDKCLTFAAKMRAALAVEPLPNPSPTDLTDPLFNAIWDVTRDWDIKAPRHQTGYSGMNGSHVMLILNALNTHHAAPQPLRELRDAEIAEVWKTVCPLDMACYVTAVGLQFARAILEAARQAK